MEKTKRIVDPKILEIFRLTHKDFPRLNESDVLSIHEMLNSEDPEVKLTGITLLDTSNYFMTPQTVFSLYSHSEITIEDDPDDTFVSIIRMLYFDSDRYTEQVSEEDKCYDENLKVTYERNINK